MKNIKYIFPNALTLVNLVLGCLAITEALIGLNDYNAAWLIIAAAFFDVLDGFVAKRINARSEFGVQLDSLADMVSFGVAPSIIIYRWFSLVLIELSRFSTFELTTASFTQNLILLCSFLFAVAVAIRLARFNITSAKTSEFQGLPSTAAALIVSSIWLVFGDIDNQSLHNFILNIYFVFAVLIILIVLMLSKIRMISLKFDGADLRKNLFQYVIIAISVVLVLIFRVEGIFLTLMFYLLLSLIINIFKIKT